jgi:hypothetical protein
MVTVQFDEFPSIVFVLYSYKNIVLLAILSHRQWGILGPPGYTVPT